MPAAQLTQLVEPKIDAYMPTAHLVHSDWPASENVPSAHLLSQALVAPVTAEKKPGEQPAQSYDDDART